MLLLTPVCVGCSTILVLAVLTPSAICYKPLRVCLHPHQQDVNYDVEQNNQNFECQCVQNSPLTTSFRPKDKKIIKVPSVRKSLANVEDKAIRHVPVVQKVRRNVVECRTRHIPVIRHRFRTVEEKYTEHVPVTQTITRPVVDTIVKQVPVIQAKKRGIHQRIKAIPTDQRVVNELFKLRQNPLYRQGMFGLPCLCPQPYNQQAYITC